MKWSLLLPRESCCRYRHSTRHSFHEKQLGGSWVVISGILSPIIWVIIVVALLITPLITTYVRATSYLDHQCRHGSQRSFALKFNLPHMPFVCDIGALIITYTNFLGGVPYDIYSIIMGPKTLF